MKLHRKGVLGLLTILAILALTAIILFFPFGMETRFHCPIASRSVRRFLFRLP